MSFGKKTAEHEMIELKAKVDDLPVLREKLRKLGGQETGVLRQTDTYYDVPKGRLKLREIEGRADSELIYYERENVAEPKRSSVFILQVLKTETWKRILDKILKIKAVVCKKRERYSYGAIEVHLDTVEGLGHFIEFECKTLRDAARQKEDLAKFEDLRKKLGISQHSFERFSYSDLALRKPI